MTGLSPVLADPRGLGIPVVHGQPPIAEVPALREVVPTIGKSNEPFEEVSAVLAALPVYWQQGWAGATQTAYVRAGVHDRLVSAQALLPPRFTLVLLDGWRSPELQGVLYQHYYNDSDLPEGFVTKPTGSRVPPHQTGGAIDITLGFQGKPLALGTEFDAFDPDAAPSALEAQPMREPERSLRRLLYSALTNAGFVGHPQEWWQFSYGDQIWAERLGLSSAIYGAASPHEFFCLLTSVVSDWPSRTALEEQRNENWR